MFVRMVVAQRRYVKPPQTAITYNSYRSTDFAETPAFRMSFDTEGAGQGIGAVAAGEAASLPEVVLSFRTGLQRF